MGKDPGVREVQGEFLSTLGSKPAGLRVPKKTRLRPRVRRPQKNSSAPTRATAAEELVCAHACDGRRRTRLRPRVRLRGNTRLACADQGMGT